MPVSRTTAFRLNEGVSVLICTCTPSYLYPACPVYAVSNNKTMIYYANFRRSTNLKTLWLEDPMSGRGKSNTNSYASVKSSASQNRGELSYTSGRNQATASSLSNRLQLKWFSHYSLLSTLSSLLGGRAYSALPCAGAPPPQRPLSYNMPHRPGVDIGDRCLIEGVWPTHVPPVPSDPRTCRPRACPRSRPH